MDQPGKIANPARGQLDREDDFFSVPVRTQDFWSRKKGLAVPSCVSLLISYTQAESGTYSRDSSFFSRRRPFTYLYRHPPSGQSRCYQVVQLRTDDVHFQVAAGVESVVLRVVPITSVDNRKSQGVSALTGLTRKVML